MLLEHASYDYPSHLIPLLDLVLTLLVLLLLLRRRRGGPWLRRLWAAARRASRRTPRMVAGVFLFGVLASVGVELVLGPPLPHVVDEIAYLHAAETFAGGELARPVHPHQEHFEAMHVLQRPTVQAKYPPAQGLVLSLGVLVGHPSAALWLLAGLLGASLAWCLAGWLPAPWPLVGSVAVLLRVGVGSYWNQSYWGGSLAAIGAALLLGGTRRALDRGDPRAALLLGTGIVLLASSRPYEGLLFALPFALVVGLWLFGGLFGGLSGGLCGRPSLALGTARRMPTLRRWLRVGLPVAGVLAVAGAALGTYHHAVTGDALVFPHSVYTADSMPGVRHFLYPPAEPGGPWIGRALRSGLQRLAVDVQFQVGLLGGLLALLALPRLRRDAWLACAAASGALVAGGHFLTRPWHAHYAAPLVPVLTLFAILGLRRATTLHRRRGRPARLLAAAFVALQLAVCLVQLPAHRVDADHPSRQRQAVERHLLATPGRDLVFLGPPELLLDEWLRNAADPDAAPVVWARSLAPAQDEALRAYYDERRVWYLDVKRRGAVLHRHRPEGPVALRIP